MVSEADKDEATGRIKEAAGNLTDNKDLKKEGKKDQASADMKDKVGKAQDKANDAIDKFTK